MGASNISTGIPEVESQVIYRGDYGRLYTRIGIESQDVDLCWKVRTAEEAPKPIRDAMPNPFARSKLAGRGFKVPGTKDKLAEKYVFWLNKRKRVELFTIDQTRIAAMNLVDVSRDVSAGILIRDWSTAPIDYSWFEMSQPESCQQLQDANQIAQWDLMRVFFPIDLAPLEEDSRRLNWM